MAQGSLLQTLGIGAQEDLGFLVLGYLEVRVCLGFCMPVLPDFLEFTREFRARPTLGG